MFFEAETSIKLFFFRNIVHSIKTIFTVTHFKNVTGEKENQNDLYHRLFNKRYVRAKNGNANDTITCLKNGTRMQGNLVLTNVWPENKTIKQRCTSS